MKKISLITLTLVMLSFVFGTSLKAQIEQTVDREAVAQAFKDRLKGLVPLDPFKLTEEQTKSFNIQTNPEIYNQDGVRTHFDQLTGMMSDISMIVIPYAKPDNKNKIVLMLVRPATSDEKEAQRLIKDNLGQSYTEGGIDPNALDLSKPGTYEKIKFDPNITKEEAIKGLREMPVLKMGIRQMNVGRVAFFDEKGKFIPMDLPDGKPNPVWEKYMNDPNFTHVEYCDKIGLIKASVYRKATLEEKKRKGTKSQMTVPIDEAIAGSGGSSSGTGQLETKNTDGTSVIGTPIEDFSAKDINAKDLSLSQYKGKKVVVLNFWFTRCKPCVEEMPALNKLVDEYQGKDVVFISLCNDDVNTINEFLKAQAFKYQIIPNTLKLANKYNVGSFPTHIVVDKDGKIAFQESGYGANGRLEDRLKTAIDGKL